MTAMPEVSPVTPLRAGLQPVELSVSPLDDHFEHFAFTEDTNRELALTAWRMHALGYYAAGFIDKAAITMSGLDDSIDKARGSNVDYFLTLDDRHAGATMRKVHVPKAGSVADLPGYQLTHEAMDQSSKTYLNQDSRQHRIKEISALARTSPDPMSLYEIIRRSINTARGRDEVWFFSIVANTLDNHLVPSLGSKNFEVIGDEVPIGGDHVKDHVVLKPVLFWPDRFLTNMLDSLDEVETEAEQQKLLHSLQYFSHNLPPERMSRSVQRALKIARVSEAATRTALVTPIDKEA